METYVEKENSFIWIKKHVDTVMVLGTLLSCVFWMNTKFSALEKDIAIIKTVLIMKNIMPQELCKTKEVKAIDKET